jgi:hypothetical protein
MTPPPEKPPQPASAGLLSDLIGRVLSYANTPTKAAILIALFLIGGFGWAAYEKRDILFESWLTPSTPELKTAEIPGALEKLATETDADLVQIWAVDLSSNSQWFMAARRHDGERPVIPSPRRLPIIVGASDIRALIDVLEGHPYCIDLEKTGSPLARRLADRGMKRGCAIPIPPNPESFVGVIYLAWSIPTDASSENVAIGAAREIARKLATH